MKASSSLKHLYISSTRQKLIGIFFYSPQEIFYVRQLVRLTEEEINSVRRELQNLKTANVIESEWRGNRLYYWANRKSPIFIDLVILANKITGLGAAIYEKKELVGNIKLMLCSFRLLSGAPPKSEGVDMVIVGDISIKEIENLVKQDETRRNREINYMVMGKSELQLRKSKRDPFIVDFLLENPLIIMGSPLDSTS